MAVTMSAGALEQLPPRPNRVSRYYDLDGDGRLAGHECIGIPEGELLAQAVLYETE
ncbi:MAG: hypothetical protein ABI037_03350 [Gemmatimonadales bacterium]